MPIRRLFAVTLLSAAMMAPVGASAAAPSRSPSPCILREHRVTAVAPYKVKERIGRASIQRLRGAEVRVQAEPGLTAEWLRLELGRHMAEMRGPASMPDCSFDVEDVRVEVTSADAGFAVKLITSDSEKAQEVLRRARLLLEPIRRH